MVCVCVCVCACVCLYVGEVDIKTILMYTCLSICHYVHMGVSDVCQIILTDLVIGAYESQAVFVVRQVITYFMLMCRLCH